MSNSQKKVMDVVDRRYDFVFLFDVIDGNPNGDPDGGNSPRIDPQTLRGFVTDVCIKRKIRNAVQVIIDGGKDHTAYKTMLMDETRQHEIYVKHQGILANEQRRAFKAINAEPSASPNLLARAWMCKNFFDVRAFGAVMTTGKTDDDTNAKKEGKRLWNCGQVRGPAQFTFAHSIDQICSMDVRITRVALTNAGDTKRATSIDDQTGEEKAGSGQFGMKSTVPYGLYKGYGFINPYLAKDTKFSYGDLFLLLDAMIRMFDFDRSASRGLMSLRKIFLFEHGNALGNGPAHLLFDRVEVPALGLDRAPRQFSDYTVRLNRESLSPEITVYELPEDFEKFVRTIQA